MGSWCSWLTLQMDRVYRPVHLSTFGQARADLKLPLHCKPQTALVKKACRSLLACRCLCHLLCVHIHDCLQVVLSAQGRCAVKPRPWRGQQTQVSWSNEGLQAPAVSAHWGVCSQHRASPSQCNCPEQPILRLSEGCTPGFQRHLRGTLSLAKTLPLQCAAVQLSQQRTAGSAHETPKQGVPQVPLAQGG